MRCTHVDLVELNLENANLGFCAFLQFLSSRLLLDFLTSTLADLFDESYEEASFALEVNNEVL